MLSPMPINPNPCRDEAVQDDKAYLRQHNHLLADYLENFESIADEVDLRASRSEDTFLEQTAIRLRGNVHELRQVSSPSRTRPIVARSLSEALTETRGMDLKWAFLKARKITRSRPLETSQVRRA